MTNILILGGTSEATAFARVLADDERFCSLMSFAGRTRAILAPAIRHRIGGFGGIEGLVKFLRDEKIEALVDATHPFAAQISAHAVAAATMVRIPLLRFERPAWSAGAGDRWIDVPDMASAAAALGLVPQRVFLTVGKLEIAAFLGAPQHDYLVRAIDHFDAGLPHAHVIAARGPFSLDDERALLRHEKIDIVVTKNSGAGATAAKLQAARELGLPVVMVARPDLPPAANAHSVDEVMQWLSDIHAGTSTRRGE